MAKTKVQDRQSTTRGAAAKAAPDRSLVEGHLTLVEQIVVQVAVNFPRHVDRGELVRAGVLGLVEAANRFDQAKGVPFDKFASRRIRGAILDAVRSADWAPRSVRALARKADSAEQRLASKLGRMPSMEELATEVGATPADLAALRDRVFRSVVLALDYRLGEAEEDLTLVDVLCDRTVSEPSEELEAREMRAYLRDAVHLLPERHRLVITGYFLEGRTSEELARFLAVTESRISQLRSEALEMLREAIEAQYRPADETDAVPTKGNARVAKRKQSYAAAVATKSSWKSRLDQVTTAEPLVSLATG